MTSLGSIRAMNNLDIREGFIWFCVSCREKCLQVFASFKLPFLYKLILKTQCWCGFGSMSFDSTPKCINEVCPHSCCKYCSKEPGKIKDKTTALKAGAKSSEEIRVSYTPAAPSYTYEAQAEPQAEPQLGLTLTPATTHSFAAPGTASASYTSDLALSCSTFGSASCFSPQSRILDSSAPFSGGSFPVPSGDSFSFGLLNYPGEPSAPLSVPSCAFDIDFDPAFETSFVNAHEIEEDQLDFAEPTPNTQNHIAALQKDRDLVQGSQVAAGPTPTSDKDTDANTITHRKGKRPREASPEMPAESSCETTTHRPTKRTAGLKDGRILTCPFVWVNNESHPNCLKLRLRRIRDVKQHLRRKHKQPYYCRRCKAVFKDGADSVEAQEHDNSDTRCPRRDDAKVPDGVTQAQFVRLEKKSKADLVTQWNYIWEVLFPDAVESKPQSPFLTDRLARADQLTAFGVFVQTHGQQILQANPKLAAHVDIVRYGFDILLDEFNSRSEDYLDT